MEILKTQCPNCGASLEMDYDKLMVYCPYCRTKLPINVNDNIENIMAEREKSKRLQMSIDGEILREKEEHRSKIADLIIVAIIFLMVFIFLIIWMFI